MSSWRAGSFKFVLTIVQPSSSLWAKHNASLGKDVNQGGGLALAVFSLFYLDPCVRIEIILWMTGYAEMPSAWVGRQHVR